MTTVCAVSPIATSTAPPSSTPRTPSALSCTTGRQRRSVSPTAGRARAQRKPRRGWRGFLSESRSAGGGRRRCGRCRHCRRCSLARAATSADATRRLLGGCSPLRRRLARGGGTLCGGLARRGCALRGRLARGGALDGCLAGSRGPLGCAPAPGGTLDGGLACQRGLARGGPLGGGGPLGSRLARRRRLACRGLAGRGALGCRRLARGRALGGAANNATCGLANFAFETRDALLEPDESLLQLVHGQRLDESLDRLEKVTTAGVGAATSCAAHAFDSAADSFVDSASPAFGPGHIGTGLLADDRVCADHHDDCL